MENNNEEMEANYAQKIEEAIKHLPSSQEKLAFINGAIWGSAECKKLLDNQFPNFSKLLNINSDTEDGKII